jgi:PAS domain S-box-containing protein
MTDDKKRTSQFHKTTPRASLELLYRISREIATTLDLAVVLERVLSLSMKTIGASSGSIIILDEKENPLESAIIIQDQVIYHTNEQLRETLDHGLAGWVVKNRDAVHIPDTRKDERWLRRPNDDETATGKSVVALPIMARQDLMGVITLSHPQPNQLQREHVALVSSIADQAGIAVLNAKLYGDSLRQARVMTALANSAKAMSSTLRLETVLDNILKDIQNALQVEAVTLSLIDYNEGVLEYKAAIHDKLPLHASLVGKRIRIGQGFAGTVAETGDGVIVPDTTQDPRFSQTNQLYPEVKPNAVIAAPIFIPGRVLGVLEAINPYSGHFEPDSLQVLSGIGSLAGSFIQNAQLYEDLQVTHQRYYDLFENSADPIIITDLGGEIVEINNRTMVTSKFSQEEIKSMSITDIHEVDWREVGQDFSRLLDHQTCSYESSIKTNDDSEIPVLVKQSCRVFSGTK